MKKVLIFANSLIGLTKFRKELLVRLLEDKYEVYISSPNDEEFFSIELQELGCKFIETKMSRRGINPIIDLKLFINYFIIIKKIKPDIVLTYTIKPNIYASIVAQILKVKYINNVTGLGTAFQKKSFLSKILKELYRIAFSNSSKVFFQNRENLEFFLENNIISEKEKIILIPGSGVNLEKFSPIEKLMKDENKIFLFIGRIMKEKGIEEYLEVAKKIKARHKNVEFWILGMYEEEKYKENIEKLQIEGVVKYLGISNDVREWIKECDYLVQPSYHEGMSNVILEASAMGKLVIASDIAGCREAIYNKQFLFEKGNVRELEEKTDEVLKGNIDYDKESIAQRKFVIDNFSREYVVEKYLEIIK